MFVGVGVRETDGFLVAGEDAAADVGGGGGAFFLGEDAGLLADAPAGDLAAGVVSLCFECFGEGILGVR